MGDPLSQAPPPDVRLRRPTEADHAAIVALADDWWDESRARIHVARVWFRHAAGSSWLAEDERGQPAGILLGFASPDRADEAVVVALAVAPAARRRGIARALLAAFAADARAAGRRRLVAAVRPDRPKCLRFLAALGFRPLAGPGIARIYGVPAIADYDGPGEDRAILVRELH